MARRVQWFVLALALGVWSIWPTPYNWSLIAAYLVAWGLAHAVDRSLLTRPWPRPLVWLVLIVVVAVPVAGGYRHHREWGRNEGFRGLLPHLEDRIDLERTPAIFPATVFHDRPQTFYGYAPGAETLLLEVGAGAEGLAGVAIGDGLFRFEFDPRRDGGSLTESRSLPAVLVHDGRRSERRLGQVHFEEHPRWFDSAPRAGLAVTPSEETDELFVVSRTGFERALPVGDGPTAAVFVDDDRALVVSHRYDPDLWRIPLTGTAEPQRLTLGPFQVGLARLAEGDLLAVAVAGERPRIDFVDAQSFELLTRVPLEFRPDWLAFGRHAGELVVSDRAGRSLHRLSRDENGAWQADGRLELGRPVVALTPSRDGASLYVAVTDHRPDAEPRRANHFVQDQLLTIDLGQWKVSQTRLTGRRSERQGRAGNIDSGVGPSGLVERRDGSLLVAFSGSEEIWVLPAGAHHPGRVFRGLELDLISPLGVADLGGGFWAASSPAGGAVAVFDGDGEMVDYIGLAPSDAELLAEPPDSTGRHALELRAGERAFNEASRAGISCASCHLHADTDHTPHNIGQRPLLPTLTVRGIAGTSPYLRDGSFPRVRDLDTHLARTLYRGYRRYLPHRGALLETYVESLPRDINPRSLGERDLARERAGREVFKSSSCELCHVPPAFTNLGRHPVRALFPEYGAEQRATSFVDTPSLLGSHARSHFLQDGRAHDLFEVLETHNASDRHGRTSTLTAGERQALVHFLESL